MRTAGRAADSATAAPLAPAGVRSQLPAGQRVDFMIAGWAASHVQEAVQGSMRGCWRAGCRFDRAQRSNMYIRLPDSHATAAYAIQGILTYSFHADMQQHINPSQASLGRGYGAA